MEGVSLLASCIGSVRRVRSRTRHCPPPSDAGSGKTAYASRWNCLLDVEELGRLAGEAQFGVDYYDLWTQSKQNSSTPSEHSMRTVELQGRQVTRCRSWCYGSGYVLP